jgi:ribosomal protein L37AE/L43A
MSKKKRILEVEAIRKAIGRLRPCEHDNADTSLGNGKIWAKCEDCGHTFDRANWDSYKKSAMEFDNAFDLLADIEKELVKHRGL